MLRGQILIATIALLGTLSATGCEFFDAFKPGSGQTVVNVFATHHATPENGIIPDRGGDGEARVFENDEGWTVHLSMGYVTTRAVTLHRCDGDAMPVDVYFGSLAEDLSTADFDRFTIGGTEVGRAELCAMTVHYGPFDDATDDRPDGAETEDVDGYTLVLTASPRAGENRFLRHRTNGCSMSPRFSGTETALSYPGNEDSRQLSFQKIKRFFRVNLAFGKKLPGAAGAWSKPLPN